MKMVKTQVYLPEADLKELHRVARRRGRKVAELIRDAVREVWLHRDSQDPVDLWTGPLNGGSADHDAAFDEL
jgi:metal-responsive CopG/Arc/MetJ family transcriptional regulator